MSTTRTIATKIAFEGEEQYKNALKNINSSLGTLKSELKLVESQFSGQANSYAALSARVKRLQNCMRNKAQKLAHYQAR